MPTRDQFFAVIIGRTGGVAQPVGCVAIHAGLATDNPLASALCRSEKSLDAGGVDGAKTGHGGGAMGYGQIKIPLGDAFGILRIIKAHFFGKGIGIEPVNQPLAPTGDNRGLWIMDMGVDKACNDQLVTVIGHGRLGILRA